MFYRSYSHPGAVVLLGDMVTPGRGPPLASGGRRPPVHGAVQPQRTIWPQTSAVLRLRLPGLREPSGGGHWSRDPNMPPGGMFASPSWQGAQWVLTPHGQHDLAGEEAGGWRRGPWARWAGGLRWIGAQLARGDTACRTSQNAIPLLIFFNY